jgi:hypothetical protein
VKRFILLACLLVATLAHGREVAYRLNYETAFVPLNETCDVYYSLNPPNKVCLDGLMYYRVYNVKYEYADQVHKAVLHYIPEQVFNVDRNGLVIAPNHNVRPDQRF